MIRVALFTNQLVMGGVEKALINLLDGVNYEKYSVDVYLLRAGGELYNDLSENVTKKVLKPIRIYHCFEHPWLVIQKAYYLERLKTWTKYSFDYQNYISSKLYLPLKEHYDIAISYHSSNAISVFYTIDGVKAKHKVLWLHSPIFDYSNLPNERKLLQKYYSQYDTVMCLCEEQAQQYKSFVGSVKQNIRIRQNVLDIDLIKRSAKEKSPFSLDDNSFKILTVGRLSDQKGIDVAIGICKRLIDDGYDVKWYVCGDGSLENELSEMIREKSLENIFILTGNQLNPYKYMANCDLYVQPSRYEGFCTTTLEAKLLGKYVITSEVCGMKEQFPNREIGLVLPLDEDKFVEEIESYIDTQA